MRLILTTQPPRLELTARVYSLRFHVQRLITPHTTRAPPLSPALSAARAQLARGFLLSVFAGSLVSGSESCSGSFSRPGCHKWSEMSPGEHRAVCYMWIIAVWRLKTTYHPTFGHSQAGVLGDMAHQYLLSLGTLLFISVYFSSL